MKRSKFTDDQILAIVREGEAGRKVADLCRAHGITEQTYYRPTDHVLLLASRMLRLVTRDEKPSSACDRSAAAVRRAARSLAKH